MSTSIARAAVLLFGVALVLTACQSFESFASGDLASFLAGGPRHVMLPMRLRGAHPTHAWRKWGRIKRMITFPTPVQHVVVIVMENRTVDNLFSAYYGSNFCGPSHSANCGSALDLYNPNAPSPGPTLVANPLSAPFDPDHHHDNAWMWDIQSQWNQPPKGCKTATCPVGATQYSYVPSSDTAPYKQLLQSWEFADDVLQANEGPSFVAHQYFIAAQSGGITGASSAPDAEAENPGIPPDAEPTGDFAESDDAVDLIKTAPCLPGNSLEDKTIAMSIPAPTLPPTPMKIPGMDNGTPWAPPCEEYSSGPPYHGTILDEIANRQGIPGIYDWQYIARRDNSIWAAPMGVNHLYNCWISDPTDCAFMIDPDAIGFVQNLASPGPTPTPFAALTYITPCGLESDHPYPNPAATPDGPEWLAWVINAIGESKYWNSTAIIVVWDDWGGWFDHEPLTSNHGLWVTPSPNPYNNPRDPNEWGFRVPLFVISPYITAPGYVSTTSGNPKFQWRSQSAILQFIETVFQLPTLGGDDMQENYTDELSDMFNMGRTPLLFSPIPEPSAWHPPTVTGTCFDGFAGGGPSVRHRHRAHRVPRLHATQR